MCEKLEMCEKSICRSQSKEQFSLARPIVHLENAVSGRAWSLNNTLPIKLLNFFLIIRVIEVNHPVAVSEIDTQFVQVLFCRSVLRKTEFTDSNFLIDRTLFGQADRLSFVDGDRLI